MALKENLDYIKNELNTQEQVLEKFIKSERFIKKYKYIILALILIIIAFFSYKYISGYIKEKNNKENNEIFLSLIQNPQDENKLKTLKAQNPNLYALFLLNNNQIDTLKNEAKDLKLDPLISQIININFGDYSFIPDYKKLLDGYELLKDNKIKQAHELFDQISDPALQDIIKNLKHYQGL